MKELISALPCPGAAVSPGEASALPPEEGTRVLGLGQLGQQPPPQTRAPGC